MTRIHVYAPGPDLMWIVRRHCPTCQKDRYFIQWHTPWLGWDKTCLRCGDHWADGELTPRPFERGWRQKAVASVKRFYRAHRGSVLLL